MSQIHVIFSTKWYFAHEKAIQIKNLSNLKNIYILADDPM